MIRVYPFEKICTHLSCTAKASTITRPCEKIVQKAGCHKQCVYFLCRHVYCTEDDPPSRCQHTKGLDSLYLYVALSRKWFRSPKGFRRNGFRGNAASDTMTCGTSPRNSASGRNVVLLSPAQGSISEHITIAGSAKTPYLRYQEPVVHAHKGQEYD